MSGSTSGGVATLGAATVFAGDGKIAALMRAFDWSATPVGPVEHWPQSLRTVVRIMLDSRYSMWMGWGPELSFFYNDAYRRDTLGKKHPWALGRPFREVWAEALPDLAPRVDRVLATGKATWDEALLLFLERNGYAEETYHTFSYSPLYDDDGKMGGLFCVVTEETERVIAARRATLLRELASALATTKTEAEVFTAVEGCLRSGTPDLPFTITYLFEHDGADSRIASSSGLGSANAAGAGLDGSASWPLGAVLANNLPVTVDDLPARFDKLPTGPWQKPPTQALLAPIAQQGQTRPAGVFIAGINPHRPLDENYRGFINLFVGQVASALANARAYEEERRRAEALAEIDRAKTTFFSNVSHELRTPLTLILSPIEDSLSDPATAPAARERLDLAHRNSLRLLRLVNSLLDFSRIEAGRVQASYEPTDICSLTADLASVFRAAVERAGMRLTVSCQETGELVYVDRDMWEKVVLNLISNAFKYTLDGEIVVTLKREDGQVVLAVRDTGVGIPEQEMPNLFQRFHRIESTRARTHEGTGIGLALVQELVKLHGGTVRAESAVGKGSVFTVSIPLGMAHLPPDRIRAGRSVSSTAVGANTYLDEALRWLPSFETESLSHVMDSAPTAEMSKTSPSHGARIILADDNTDMREYVRRLLTTRGFAVEAVPDGEAALTAIQKKKPDLVLTDVMMPRLDGFGLLRTIRADPALAGVPVLILSARAGEEATVEGIEAGADDYLVKPFSARELLAKVEGKLALSQARRDRKQAEHQLAEARDRLELSVSAAELGTFYCPMPLGEIVWNAKCKEHFFLPPDAQIDFDLFYSILHEDDRQRTREAVERAVYSGEGYDVQYRTVAKDGRTRWIRAKGRAYYDAAGNPIRFDGITIDISEQKRSEEEREKLLESERSARTEAERVSRMKDEFLATLSHELRTPLNAILGWSHILKHGARDDEDFAQGIDAIERNARSQTQLIEDLLDMSRIIAGKVRLDVQRLSLCDVIEGAIEAVAPAAHAKGVRLDKVLDTAAGSVSGDPNRLQQVVWNLLSNAVKFTPKGGKVLVVFERVNSHVEISVTDSGKGIKPEFLPFVFERFRQEDASTTRKHGGLGLGLSIVKHLTELHGGSVRAKSPGEGQGATFTIALPLSAAHHESDGHLREHPSAEPPEAANFDPPNLRGVKVLVVDDDKDARDVIGRMLADSDATILSAASAAEGLEILQRERPHLLVSDIGMPNMDGYEFARKVRQLPPSRGGNTPAIALTAFARSEDRRRALLAGFQMHVAKPVEPAELLTICASLAGTQYQFMPRSTGGDANK